jgi:hypothetical protein
VFFLFDLLYLDGEDLRPRPLIERKQRLSALLANAGPYLHYSDHVLGQGPAFYEKAGAMHVGGIVSKRTDAPYTPANRGLWRKVKCLTARNLSSSAGPSRKEGGLISAPCCSAITTPTAGSSMRGAWAAACGPSRQSGPTARDQYAPVAIPHHCTARTPTSHRRRQRAVNGNRQRRLPPPKRRSLSATSPFRLHLR